MEAETRTALAVIDQAECWELLRTHRVGRLAVKLGARPHIFPVNYLLGAKTILFRTDAGTKLASVLTAGPVAFEIDETDERVESGWSVVVEGRAREVLDRKEVELLEAGELRSWVPGRKAHFVRIEPDSITGRRIVRVLEPEGPRPAGS
jgi:uncharacterized protein